MITVDSDRKAFQRTRTRHIELFDFVYKEGGTCVTSVGWNLRTVFIYLSAICGKALTMIRFPPDFSFMFSGGLPASQQASKHVCVWEGIRLVAFYARDGLAVNSESKFGRKIFLCSLT